QGLVVFQPHDLRNAFTLTWHLTDKLAIHIRYKQLAPRHKRHFLAIRRDMKIADIACHVKFLGFTQYLVTAKTNGRLAGFLAGNVIDKELIPFLKNHRSTIGSDLRTAD